MISNNLNSQFVLVGPVTAPDSQSINFGQTIQWLSSDLFSVVTNLNENVFYDEWKFSDGAYFDGGNTNFGELTTNSQQLDFFQVLKTDRSWINSTEDILQAVPVGTQTLIGANQPNVVYSGAIDNLFLADANNPDYAIKIFNNPNLSHGWAVSTAQQSPIDPGTISRAWIYDSVTQTKLADLEVVDVFAGVLPGAIAQELDFVCDVDPACYNIPAWGPGIVYSIGDRITYNSQIYQALYAGKSGSVFNSALWTLISPQAPANFTGITQWGSTQVGKTWFDTSGLKAVNAQLGTLFDRAQNWNQWFPTSTIIVYEWVNSTVPPANYTSNSTNGFVLDPNCAYTYEASTGTYGFWVANKTATGPLHDQSIAQLAQDLSNIPGSGIPMITVIDTNAVAVWNINQYLNSNTIILHIDYVIESANNQLHNEFILVSNDGTKSWLPTPIYPKLVDSLSGVTEANQLVPTYTIPASQQIGILNNPVQSLFVNRIEALKIYFDVVNQQLANLAVASTSVINALSGSDPIPTTGFNEQIPNRAVLAGLDSTLYPENYKILLTVDDTLSPACWSIVASVENTWQIFSHQNYNLANYWEYSDWYSSNYTSATPTFTIANPGELSLISYSAGDTIEILNTGNGNQAIYLAAVNDLDSAVLELDPIYIQNGTIQFLPTLFDFAEAEIGFDTAPFDQQYFDNDPYIPIRLIVQALNNTIFVGSDSLLAAADESFYSILNYILYENQNLDWLFKSSFITVDYNNRNLDVQGNFTPDNANIIENFVDESTPYHTRIREFRDGYNVTDYGNIGTIDFDLPAQYDSNYANVILDYSSNPKQNTMLQLSQFTPNVGVASDQHSFYVLSSGLPAQVAAQLENDYYSVSENLNFGFPRYPVSSSIQYDTVNNLTGPIAAAIDGVPFYSADSGQTETLYLYGSNASPLSNISISQTFTLNSVYVAIENNEDPGAGFATANVAWQYLANPYKLYSQNANTHSPIIGYAWDGVPIYGPYGYQNVDGTGNIVIQTSSWQLKTEPRLDADGYPIVNGLQLAGYAAPTGEYIEDFEYVPGSGLLDQNNGRWCVTPEYPGGTYAYFVTVSPTDGVTPVYPYVIGPQYNSIPFGLKYVYIDGVNTPVYPNGNVTVPMPVPFTKQAAVRTPDGSVSTDNITLQEPIYSPWNDNHSYSVGQVTVSYPGEGYQTLNSIINFISVDGNGSNAAANVFGLCVSNISLVNSGNNYAIGDILSFIGGTFSNAAQVEVTSVNSVSNSIVSYNLLSVPEQNYTALPSNIANISTANVTGNGSGATFNALFGVNSIYVSNIGAGYTSTPIINITDDYATANAVLYPVLFNNKTRKISSTLRFDRVSPTVEYLASNISYPLGSIVYSNVNSGFIQALVANAISTQISNAAVWGAANVNSIDVTTAMNRITASYTPTTNMFGISPELLMTGVEYPGVVVSSPAFPITYPVPTGSIFDYDDPNDIDISLNISWRPGLVSDTALSREYSRFGNTSGVFNTEYNQYMSINPNNSSDSNLIGFGNNLFTLEFYINLSNISSNINVLVDTRNNANSTHGLVVYTQNGNVCIGNDTFSPWIDSNALPLVANQWNYLVIQGTTSNVNAIETAGISCYINGALVGTANIAYNFTDTNFIVGADVSGNKVTTGYMDELRLSTYINRYNPDVNIPVTDQTFPNNIDQDPYFLAHYTPILWGFEGFVNESPANITFQSVNAQQLLSDLSWNRKQLRLINYGANLVIDSSTVNTITSPQSSEILAVKLNQG